MKPQHVTDPHRYTGVIFHRPSDDILGYFYFGTKKEALDWIRKTTLAYEESAVVTHRATGRMISRRVGHSQASHFPIA